MVFTAKEKKRKMERNFVGYENGIVMTRDPKPRLRWTSDLHDRFVDAVTKLGGPESSSFFFFLFFNHGVMRFFFIFNLYFV